MMHILVGSTSSLDLRLLSVSGTRLLLRGSFFVFDFARTLFAKMAGGIGLGLGLLVHSEESRILWVFVCLRLAPLDFKYEATNAGIAHRAALPALPFAKERREGWGQAGRRCEEADEFRE